MNKTILVVSVPSNGKTENELDITTKQIYNHLSFQKDIIPIIILDHTIEVIKVECINPVLLAEDMYGKTKELVDKSIEYFNAKTSTEVKS